MTVLRAKDVQMPKRGLKRKNRGISSVSKKRRLLFSLFLGMVLSGSEPFLSAADFGNLSVDAEGKVSLLGGKTDYSLLSGEFIPGSAVENQNLTFVTPQTFTNAGAIGYSAASMPDAVNNLNANQIGLFINQGQIIFTGTMTVSSSGLFNYGQISGNTSAAGGVSTSGTIVNGLATNDPGSVLRGTVRAAEGITNYRLLDGLDNTAALLNVSNATLDNSGTVENYLTVAADSLINETGASLTNNINIETSTLSNNGAITGTGSAAGLIRTSALNNQTGGTISGYQSLNASNSLLNLGAIDQIRTITASSGLDNSGGLISNVEEILVPGSGTSPKLINNGTLENIGSITGSVSLGSSGEIKMTGISQETKFNGTLTVNGGTLTVRLTAGVGGNALPGVDNDFYNLNGTDAHADLIVNGGKVSVIAADYDPARPDQILRAGDRYTFIQGNDITVGVKLDVEGTPGAGYKGLLRFTPSFDDDNYYLNVERTVNYAELATTENGANMGGYLDSLGGRYVMGSDLESVLVALDRQYADGGAGAVRNALSQLDGAIYGSLASMAAQNQTIVNTELANRLRPQKPGEFLWSYSQTSSCDSCSPCIPRTQYWGNYYGVTGDAESDGNAAGGDYSVHGVIAGGDRIFADNLRIGGFFAFGDAEYDENGLNNVAESDSYKAGLYFLRSVDAGYFLGHVNYGWSNDRTERKIAFLGRGNTADFSSKQWAFRLEKGFNYTCGQTLFQPFAALHYFGYESGAFDETGAGSTALSIDGSEYNSWRSELGGRFVWERQYNESAARNLFLQASWLHEYGDTRGTVAGCFQNPNSSQFSGSGGYSVYGVDLGRDWYNAGIGLDVAVNNMNFFGGYDFFTSDAQSLYTGNAGFSFRF